MSENATLLKIIPVFAGQVSMTAKPEHTAVADSYLSATSSRAAVTEWDRDRKGLALSVPESISFSEDAIRQQLGHILQSSLFVQSERLSRFLRFIVEQAVAGNQKYLKEYVIGSEVYDRKPPYHPSRDSIVRTEARRLRNKLKEYYETEGKNDSLYVHLRLGSHIPVFQSKAVFVGVQNVAALQNPLTSTKSTAVVAVFAFTDISGSLLSSKCARGISDELAFTLVRGHGCRVISPVATTHALGQEQGVAAAMTKVGAHIAFEGSVREENKHIRVIARIVDAAGFHLWATRFDADATTHTMFAIEEQIVACLAAGFNSLFAAAGRCG